ncbi:response regulator [Desulfobacterales bacterium HSG2]|nr:response regulator [Desulfobacterales bacterium HSG2]
MRKYKTKFDSVKGVVLIVDDNPANLEVITDYLKDCGFRILIAGNGEIALERVNHSRPDIILLDVMMPGIDGFETCRRLKSDEDTRDIPVIFMTALAETEDKVRGFSAGAVDYLTKPVQKEELVARVTTHLRLRKLTEQLEHTVQQRTRELTAANQQLTREIAERVRAGEELRTAKETAEAANKAKSVFLSNMSHELRTPMNAILGFSQLLGHSTNLDPEEQKNLGIIRRSGELLLNLINDVLDMSKIEAGRAVLTEKDFDMYCLLDGIEDMFRLKAEEKGLRLVFECDAGVPRYVRADEGKLQQVLVNLFSNAVKFTQEGGITLKVINMTTVEEDDLQSQISDLRFAISDTGPGIAPDELDSLFDAFAQTETGRKSQEGTGLGLPISQKFVRMMGGNITVESGVGRGTVFRFGIQAETAEGAKIETAQSERRVIALAPDQPCRRILIVDDEESNRLLLVKLLALPGFKLRVAENGKEAVEIWEEWAPHLILMDMRMPVMDGFEATKRIKAAARGRAAVIIAVTAGVFEEDRAVVLSAGCDDFMCKPFNESEIFDVIQKHLEVQYVYDKPARKPEAREQDRTLLTADALVTLSAEPGQDAALADAPEAPGREDVLVPRETDEMEEAGSEALAGIRGARILLAEDNEINRKVAVAMLEGAGLITEVAENGREAVEMLGTGAGDAAPLYDAVLMDIEMPEMDGHEATRIIRGIPEFDDLPIIAMTAYVMRRDQEKCLNAGMNDYLTKPVDEERLYAVLCKWIKPGKREIPGAFSERGKLTPESGAGLPDDLPGIDLKTVLKRVRGDAGLLRIILGSFLKKHEHAAGEIGTLLDRGKLRDARKLTHAIKGVSGNLCADALFAATRDLDTALREEKAEEARPLLEVFAGKLAQLTDALKTLNPDEESTETACQEEEADLSQAREILTEMTALLEKNRLNAWRLLEPLLNLLPDSEFRQEKAALRKAMSALDTERGISVLMKLSQKLNVSFK